MKCKYTINVYKHTLLPVVKIGGTELIRPRDFSALMKFLANLYFLFYEMFSNSLFIYFCIVLTSI